MVREGHCRRASLAHGLATFDAAGGKLLGTVFVGSRSNAGYYYDGYRYAAATVAADEYADSTNGEDRSPDEDDSG